MYKITWDKETGGVTLNSRIVEGTLGTTPRPVFWEELDLLGLNSKGWKYPHSEEPLLWAVNKQYFYHGELCFEAKGANIYDPAEIVFQPGKEELALKPVNVRKMLDRCQEYMFLLEAEAMEFIHETYTQYARARKSVAAVAANQLDYEVLAQKLEQKTRQKMAIVREDCDSFDIMPLDVAQAEGKKVYQTTKIDKFLASFSGGKDSQVVLDLCTRAIPSTEFEVIYSDTGYELPPSLELYKTIQEHYHEKFPDLKFSMARNHESVLHYWDTIGTPSDTHRWCCSVMKTAPLYKLLKSKDNKQAKVLTFDGIRAEESTRRSGYNRIGKGVKHDTVINASPILYWSAVEIFLYIWEHKLPINEAYRNGMTRVGCLICPFSSEWNDMISHRKYNENLQPFLTRIENITKKTGIRDIDVYIKSGNWKRRAGGRGLSFPATVIIESVKPHLAIKVKNPQEELLTWLRTIGPYTLQSTDNGYKKGELRYQKTIYQFSIEHKADWFYLVFENTSLNPLLQALIKRVIYKGAYCIHCGVCEVECPTGALHIEPNRAYVDHNLCISCNKCLNFHDYGCIAAASLAITGTNNIHKMKLISYNNFGMNEGWLNDYFSDPDAFFTENIAGLNKNEQMPSFAKWLQQSEIIDNADPKYRNITEFGRYLADVYEDNPDLVWQIIWVNLSYNSPIASWYNYGVDWGRFITQPEIEALVLNDYPDNSKTTVHNVVYAFIRTLKESPLGELGLYSEINKTQFHKKGFDNVEREAIAYSLYKYAEAKGTRSLKISDLFSADNPIGTYREFGLNKSTLEKILRSLNSDSNRILIAELNMGLDSISLKEGMNAFSCLKALLG